MHEFGWTCRPVERAGTEVHDFRRSRTTATDAGTVASVRTATGTTTGAIPAAGEPSERESVDRTSRPKRSKSIGEPARPQGLSAPRVGKPDNLQLISGIGPKLEKTLHSLGFYHFDQIAGWTRDELNWVDEHLRFKGRIERDDWVKQAKLLATGEMSKFEAEFGIRKSQGRSARSKSDAKARKG